MQVKPLFFGVMKKRYKVIFLIFHNVPALARMVKCTCNPNDDNHTMGGIDNEMSEM